MLLSSFGLLASDVVMGSPFLPPAMLRGRNEGAGKASDPLTLPFPGVGN
jgi:hypothetical protein